MQLLQTETTRKAPPTHRLNVVFSYVGAVVCYLVIGTVLLELGSRGFLTAYRHFHISTVSDFTPQSPAYSNFDWAPECLAEQAHKVKARNIYFPFRLWGVTEFHGTCINNDPTDLGVVRRTVEGTKPACANQPAKSIWVLGGSTVYGTGIPDWATLPSYLSRELSSRGLCANVVNLGVEGYSSNQELLLLIEKLKSGKRPDVLIIYDGFNDADFGTMPPGNPTPHMGYVGIEDRMEGRFAGRFDFLRGLGAWQLVQELTKGRAHTRLIRVPNDTLPTHAASTLNNYEQNLRMANTLGDGLGFRVYAFWQPAIMYGHKPLAGYERQLVELSSGTTYPFQALMPVYQEAERRAAKNGDFVFLGNIFDTVPDPLYLDWVHLTPAGNQIVAHEIARHIDAH
jgi:lysophospholipase L1-like esterase